MDIQERGLKDPASDFEIISRILAGEKQAYSTIVRRYNQRLYRVAMSIISDDREVEDVMQVAYIKAYENLPKFHFKSSFSTWLCSVALRAALDSMRRGKRHITDTLFEEDSSTEPPHSEDKMDIETAIAQLAPGYRMVLLLHDVEGFTHEEIGLQLGIAPGTSKAQLFKARRVMRALLTGRERKDVH